MSHETSTGTQDNGEEEKEKDFSLTNLFIEFGDMNEMLERYIHRFVIFKMVSAFRFTHINLMMDSTEEILKTFFDHECQLKRIYDEQIVLSVSSVSYTSHRFLIRHSNLDKVI